MTVSATILPYSTPTETSSKLQLRESDDGTIRIIFGVWPTWIYALAIAANSVLALLQLLVVYFLSRAILTVVRLALPNTTATSIPFWGVLLVDAVIPFGMAGLYGAAAFLQWYRLYHWGRMPRTLTATSSGLTLSQMGWFRPRHRFWPADQIASVELLKLTDFFSEKRNVAVLRIQRRNKWFRRSYRLRSKDAQLPTLIAERLAATLGCKLTIR